VPVIFTDNAEAIATKINSNLEQTLAEVKKEGIITFIAKYFNTAVIFSQQRQ